MSARANALTCIGLSFVVKRLGATCSDAVKAESLGRGSARRGQRPASRAYWLTHQNDFDDLKRERDEALGQLRATAEVLRVISNSPGELERCSGQRLTGLHVATRNLELYSVRGGLFHPVAWLDVPPAFRFHWQARHVCAQTRSTIWPPLRVKGCDSTSTGQPIQTPVVIQIRRCTIFYRGTNAQTIGWLAPFCIARRCVLS
jgi:hypothetical protein